MTTPDANQLAGLVDPQVREYIDARISEAVALSESRVELAHATMADIARTTASRIAEMEAFERTVRNHLGI